MQRAIFEAKTRLLMRRDRRAFREMLRDERLTEDESRKLTAARSARIASHAFRTTDFYREHYTAAGFTASDVARPENFDLLPVLTKQMVQEAGSALISSTSDPKNRLVSRTGGSTGRPLEIYNDGRAPTAALWWRVYSWWGIHPADDAAFIYRQSRTGMKKLRYDLEWWPTRHLLLDARGATDESSTTRSTCAVTAELLPASPPSL
jgi:phenylacetate-CoA ligase